MKKYNFTKKRIGYFVFLCTLFITFNAHSQNFKYSDDSTNFEYDNSRSLVEGIYILGDYLPTDSIQYLQGTTSGSHDLCFYGGQLNQLSVGGLPDWYGWYGVIQCTNTNWKYFTIIIKRAGKVLFKRIMPITTLNLSEDLKLKHDKYFINDYLFLTNISNLPLDVAGYSLTGNAFFQNVKLESQMGMKICEKCLLIISSPDGFVQKVKIF